MKGTVASNKPVPNVNIDLDREEIYYRDGDRISGKVRIEVIEDLKYNCVKFEALGIAIVKWKVDEWLDTATFPEVDCKLAKHHSKEIYLDKQFLVLEKEGGILDRAPVLKAGKHEFEFSFCLPPELPSSFDGQYGRIAYLIRCVFERPRKSPLVFRKPFTVKSGLDLNFIAEAAYPIKICKNKQVGGTVCCNGNKSITIDWSVSRSGYVPGQEILVRGAVQNDCYDLINYSKAVLFMIIEYKKKYRFKREEKEIACVEKGPIGPGGIEVWNDNLLVPALIPPSVYERSLLIVIRYELHLIVELESRLKPITFSREIYIGTVPVNRTDMISCLSAIYSVPHCLNNVGQVISSSMESLNNAAEEDEDRLNPTAPLLSDIEDNHRTIPSAPNYEDLERSGENDDSDNEDDEEEIITGSHSNLEDSEGRETSEGAHSEKTLSIESRGVIGTFSIRNFVSGEREEVDDDLNDDIEEDFLSEPEDDNENDIEDEEREASDNGEFEDEEEEEEEEEEENRIIVCGPTNSDEEILESKKSPIVVRKRRGKRKKAILVAI